MASSLTPTPSGPKLKAGLFLVSPQRYGEITLKNGRVEQSNFDSYPVPRMNKTPEVEVHIVQNRESQEGIGEID